MNKVIFTIVSLLFFSAHLHAYNFEVDGVYYKKLSANQVEVTYNYIDQNAQYHYGSHHIPQTVFYNGTEYQVISIGDFAFYFGNDLTGTLEIPKTIKNIGSYSFFACCNLSGTLTIPNSVETIASNAFKGCSGFTGNLTISESITKISSEAFRDCYGLTGNIIVPTGVLTIEDNAFNGCKNIDGTLILPNTVTSIQAKAFYGCKKLSHVKSYIQNPMSIPNDVFQGISSNSVLEIPVGTKEKYTKITGWSQYFKEIKEYYDNGYVLELESCGNGSIVYNGVELREGSHSIGMKTDESTTIICSPDIGYRLKSVKLNNVDVTSSVNNNQYTISNISANTTLKVEFEAIPSTVYSLYITAVGNGAVTYNSSTIRGKTSSFNVNEGTKVSITLSPDNGYRIKSVKENGTDVTASVSNQTYILNTLSRNTTIEVAFEAIPPTVYSLNITAVGNGAVTYNSSVIRGKTSSFNVNEGTKVSIALSPDNGYRIKSVKENGTDVTAYVSNQAYVINALSRNTTIEVEFEAISTTREITIGASGFATFCESVGFDFSNTNIKAYTCKVVNGKALLSEIKDGIVPAYNGVVLYREAEGTENIPIVDANFSLSNNELVGVTTKTTVDWNSDGYYNFILQMSEGHVKFFKATGATLIANKAYLHTLSEVSAYTTLEVVFEEIPPTTYSLNISVSGNGSVTYGDVNLKNQTQTFTVNEGTNAALMINPESGFRIGSVKVNNVDVTAQVVNSRYTISNIKSSTTVEVTFEAIPITTYQLSVIANGNGSVMYDGSAVRGQTKVFTVNEGTDVTLSFSPDNGNSVSNVKVNGVDVTSEAAGNHYTISGMSANTTVEVTFMVDVNALTIDGVNYKVTSQVNKTINVTGGSYGQVLTVPASVTQNGVTWMVAGIEKDALSGITDLSAIIWNPTTKFTAEVRNPNLLLYVKAEEYASSNIRNIVVNGTAPSITLTEAVSGNNFYCPQAFVAQHIIYTHHYGMTTGVNEARGWETIALPFDVQTISHAEKGAMIPFAGWSSEKAEKPFWLYEMTGNGFVKASEIKAYTPYIISMPNNTQYTDEWLLNGSVTFEAHGVYIDTSENLHKAQFKDRTFVPCFSTKSSIEGLYALNVNNDYSQNNTGMPEGSRFVLNMRPIHPFEAFMTTENNARAFIPIFENGLPTDISIMLMNKDGEPSKLYNLNGQQVEHPKNGVYIVNGKKVVIK